MIVALIVLLLISLSLLGGGLYAYRQAFYSKGSKKNVNKYFEKNEAYQSSKETVNAMCDDIDKCQCEEIYINAFDNTRLYARYFHISENAPIHILMHGYKGKANRDMCGAFKIAKSLNHNILLIDQRGCGKSEGNTITFGVKERKDALSWVKYLTQRFEKAPIILVGVSMGGATALMVTDMDLPKNVACVVADCPYSSPKEIIKKVCRDRGMPKFIYPIVTEGALLFGGFNPSKHSAIRSCQNAKIPYLIIHGMNDGFVPFYMAEQIYESGIGKKKLVAFENADHGTSYLSDPERYERIYKDFVKECLEAQEAL